jgi:hypothetical protein
MRSAHTPHHLAVLARVVLDAAPARCKDAMLAQICAREHARIRTHLCFVEERLRARNVQSFAPELRSARARHLDHLHIYWLRGEFPRNYDHPEQRIPCFIDRDGHVCAVASLMIASGYAAAAHEIAATTNNAFIAAIRSAVLDAWAAQSGLDKTELALIQPAYDPPLLFTRLNLAILMLLVAMISPVAIAAAVMNIVNTIRRRSGVLSGVVGIGAGGALLYLAGGLTHGLLTWIALQHFSIEDLLRYFHFASAIGIQPYVLASLVLGILSLAVVIVRIWKMLAGRKGS